jgi:hypothetical protein
MRRSSWTQDDHTVYLVVDDSQKIGTGRETAHTGTDLDTVVQKMLSGECGNPTRVIAFKTYERCSKDVSVEIAHELRRRCDFWGRLPPPSIVDFIERYEGRDRWQLELRGTDRAGERRFPIPERFKSFLLGRRR